MPVYLEGFNFVIRPSIKSLQAAVAAYKAEGGSASIFVNDDGLQLLSERDRCTVSPQSTMWKPYQWTHLAENVIERGSAEEICREERLQFYHLHNVAFVARPPHGKGGYLRLGRFKKASNMNYCLDISRQVETLMQASPLATTVIKILLTLAPLIGKLMPKRDALRSCQTCINLWTSSSRWRVWCRKALSISMSHWQSWGGQCLILWVISSSGLKADLWSPTM